MEAFFVFLILLNVLLIGIVTYVFVIKPRRSGSISASRISNIYGTLGGNTQGPRGSVIHHRYFGHRSTNALMHRPISELPGKNRISQSPTQSRPTSDDECIVIDPAQRKSHLQNRCVPVAHGRDIIVPQGNVKSAETVEHLQKMLTENHAGTSSSQFRMMKRRSSRTSYIGRSSRNLDRPPMARSVSPQPTPSANRKRVPRRSVSLHAHRKDTESL